ncbi:interleukin-17 receptor A [Bufo gargarizans]|uniref:interleukin-17 receptor A n=1 Tax=Bufo gargarizans TaxID=30331 RepID=UPI001CF16F0A|nr:interleukin-17 receptor A [Bufo gargarizans]
MAPGLPFFIFGGVMSAALGLRIMDSSDFNCSQPGVECKVLDSNCMDLSWLHHYTWTPTAPSNLDVTAGIRKDKWGNRVPVLQINWTVNVDSSILTLQGVEISVMEVDISSTQCVQFQFGNVFPQQRDQHGQPWKFYYNNFEVNPGNRYHIRVQHLPKERDSVNHEEFDFVFPGCSKNDLMQTDTCCKLGYCWKPNITLEVTEDKLIVTFSPERNSLKYGVKVSISPSKENLGNEISLQGATTERVQVNFSITESYKPCWYNVSVWPYMPDCKNNCVRQWYSPKCPPPSTETPIVLSRQVYVWPIAAALMILAFAVTIIFFWTIRGCFSPGFKVPPPPPPPPPVVPQVKKQKVWLVYSADHELYVNVVIRLADFLRVAWGLDVVMDRHQSQEIGVKGAMTWLSHQKDQIEKMNGTILILCSRGVQAKWRAMKNCQEARVALPEDTSYMFGDLFTPALALILPDFQKSKPYDRYVVAYFSELCDVGDIPSPLEICPQYALIENLQILLFRIQRLEHHQPNIQYNVDLEGKPSYLHLLKAIEQCRAWQETHSDWFEKQVSPAQPEEASRDEQEVEHAHECTRRIYPQIRQPETSLSMLTSCIVEPDPIRSINPSLEFGPSSVCVVPLLTEEYSPVTVVQPSLNTQALRASFRQQPFLVKSLPICNERLHQMGLSTASDQDIQSEDLSEAQKRFFCQSILAEQHINPDLAFNAAELPSGSEDQRAACMVDFSDPLLQIDSSIPCSQGIPSVDLREAQKMFFCKSIFEYQSGAPIMVSDDKSEGCLDDEEESVYERLCQVDVSIPHDQEIQDLMKTQKRFLFQIILDNRHLAPDMVFDDESRAIYEQQRLLVDANMPSMDLRETQNDCFRHSVLGGQRVMNKIDVPADDLSVYQEHDDLDFQSLHVVMGRTDNKHCHSDLGYGTMNRSNLDAVKGE